MKTFILVFALCLWGLSTQKMTAQNSLTIYLPKIPAEKQVIDTVLFYTETGLYVTRDSGAQSGVVFLFQKQPEEENFRCSFICAFPRKKIASVVELLHELGPEGLRGYYREKSFPNAAEWEQWPQHNK